MVSVPASSAVDRVLKIRSGKTKYKQIGIHCSKFDLRYAIDTWIETQFLVGFVFLLIVVCRLYFFFLPLCCLFFLELVILINYFISSIF